MPSEPFKAVLRGQLAALELFPVTALLFEYTLAADHVVNLLQQRETNCGETCPNIFSKLTLAHVHPLLHNALHQDGQICHEVVPCVSRVRSDDEQC